MVFIGAESSRASLGLALSGVAVLGLQSGFCTNG